LELVRPAGRVGHQQRGASRASSPGTSTRYSTRVRTMVHVLSVRVCVCVYVPMVPSMVLEYHGIAILARVRWYAPVARVRTRERGDEVRCFTRRGAGGRAAAPTEAKGNLSLHWSQPLVKPRYGTQPRRAVIASSGRIPILSCGGSGRSPGTSSRSGWRRPRPRRCLHQFPTLLHQLAVDAPPPLVRRHQSFLGWTEVSADDVPAKRVPRRVRFFCGEQSSCAVATVFAVRHGQP
jgi:hypothetical protein